MGGEHPSCAATTVTCRVIFVFSLNHHPFPLVMLTRSGIISAGGTAAFGRARSFDSGFAFAQDDGGGGFAFAQVDRGKARSRSEVVGSASVRDDEERALTLAKTRSTNY